MAAPRPGGAHASSGAAGGSSPGVTAARCGTKRLAVVVVAALVAGVMLAAQLSRATTAQPFRVFSSRRGNFVLSAVVPSAGTDADSPAEDVHGASRHVGFPGTGERVASQHGETVHAPHGSGDARGENRAMLETEDPLNGLGGGASTPPAANNASSLSHLDIYASRSSNVSYNSSSGAGQISIHVFFFRRVPEAERLLAALADADYGDYTDAILLHIHIDFDAAAADALRAVAEAFAWRRGPKIVDAKTKKSGLRESWLLAWRNPAPDDIMIALEDDVVISPHYFRWLLKVLREFDLLSATRRPSYLSGISLSPLRLDEISYPPRKWLSHEHLQPHAFPAYLHAVPSSWGAVYFGNVWLQFLEFVALRGAAPFYDEPGEGQPWVPGTKLGDANLWLPDSRSNAWPRSWKRFMIDFGYGRGYVMLYPNLAGGEGLATSLQLSGEHTPAAGKQWVNPRTAPIATDVRALRLEVPLPHVSELPVMGLHCEHTTLHALAKQGDAFLRVIASAAGDSATVPYDRLLQLWRRPCVLDTLLQTASASGEAGKNVTSSPGAPGASSTLTSSAARMRARARYKYVMFEPRGGLMQQMHAIVNAAFWTAALERALLIPPLMWPHVRNASASPPSEWLPFFDAFQPDSGALSRLLPGLHLAYLNVAALRAAGHQPSRYVLIEPTVDAAGAAFPRPIFDAMQWGSPAPGLISRAATSPAGLAEVDVRDSVETWPLTDAGLSQQLGSCTDHILPFNGMASRRPSSATTGTRAAVWRALLRPNPKVREMSVQIVAALRSRSRAHAFACVHAPAARTACPTVDDARKEPAGCATGAALQQRVAALEHDVVLVVTEELGDGTGASVAARVPRGSSTTMFTTLFSTEYVRREVHIRWPSLSEQHLSVYTAIVVQHSCAAAAIVVLDAATELGSAIAAIRNSADGVRTWDDTQQ